MTASIGSQVPIKIAMERESIADLLTSSRARSIPALDAGDSVREHETPARTGETGAERARFAALSAPAAA
jgi:hypothetical protein